MHWAVCKEVHENVRSYHHMSIKLSKNKRLGGIKGKPLVNEVNINFTEWHNSYITAFCYVSKTDTKVILSDSHPDLDLRHQRHHRRHQKQVKHDFQADET